MVELNQSRLFHTDLFRTLESRTNLYRKTLYRNKLQLASLAIPALYLLTLIVFAYLKSEGRRSVLLGSASDLLSPAGETNVSSRVQLQDFHRREIKNGKAVWEVKAKNAKFFPAQQLTHVNGAEMTVFRDKESDIKVQADSARLRMDLGGISKAMLEGGVVIAVGEGMGEEMKISAQSAEFDAVSKLFFAPGEVQIAGSGFSLVGKGLRFNADSGIAMIDAEVRTRFDPKAKMPKKLAD